MKNSKITYDLNLTNLLYKSNNEILIKLSIKNLDWNKAEFDKFIQTSVNRAKSGRKSIPENDLSELMNIDWIFLNSIFISLFTNFENHISKLANIVEDKIKSEIKINDIKGNGYIDKYRKYLYLIGKINSAKRNKTWDEIDIFKLTRNKLSHRGGYFNTNPNSKLEDQHGFQFLIDNKVLLAGSLGHIRIRETFFLEKFVKMTAKLSDQLKHEIERIES